MYYTIERLKPRIYQAVILVSIIFCTSIIFHLSRAHSRPPFPHLPDAPAHVPFKLQPTWDPNYNETSISKNGMVASDSSYCSELGVGILKKGGNAADAAITTCLCIGATDTMFSSGIGGGTFITSKLANELTAISIDAREMAPGFSHRNMFKNKENESKFGGLAVGIPGELKGLYTLYEKHGSGVVDWYDLVMPVANLVRKGWLIDRRLSFALEMQKVAFEYFRKDWSFVYKNNGKELLKTGDLMQRPAYANTLELIAKNGEKIFYDSKGFIANSLSMKVQEWGGILQPEDFDKYQVNLEDALQVNNFTNDNLTIFTANGASSGLALAAGISIIDNFDYSNITDFEPLETHRLIETMKWMASVRSNLGDLGVYNKNQTKLKEHVNRYNKFLSTDWISTVLSKIKTNETLPWYEYDPAYEANDPHGTSSLSVVDKDGNAVTLTTTINLLFGSCVHDPKTGIILNNEMDDFSLPYTDNAFKLAPSIYNYIEPYKRPLSSSCQSIIVNSENEVEFVVGAAGGSRITTAILQAIIRAFRYSKNVGHVIANPRLHHQLLPEIVFIEEPVVPELIDELIKRGHEVEVIRPMTAMNAIRINKEKIRMGQSDHWRKLGKALGY